MVYKILFRRGGSTLLPTLDIGEPGWETDTLTMVIGDGTSTPPQIVTTKTSSDVNYSLVPKFTFNTIAVIAGTATAPSIGFPDTANETGFYGPANGQVALAAGGVEVELAQSTGKSFFVPVTNNYTSAMTLPVGTTSQRPTGALANFRFNTTLNSGNGALEYYDGTSAWQQVVAGAANSTVPSGAVMPFAMNAAPAGWLVANGASVTTAAYPSLFAAIGYTFGGSGANFTLPDLRGYFVRGWADGETTIDNGRTFGSTQLDEFQGHFHSLPNVPEQGTGFGYTGTTGVNSVTINSTGSPTSDGTNGAPRTGTETRPINVALLYCIKT